MDNINRMYEWKIHCQGVGAGTRLSQCHDTMLYKKLYSCTDFTKCTVLNVLITMQLPTQIIENHATAYFATLYPHFQAGNSYKE